MKIQYLEHNKDQEITEVHNQMIIIESSHRTNTK